MRRVLLVSSIHNEIGNATAAELTWLLGRLRPDVLFLESSSPDCSAFLEECGALESAALMRYRNVHPVELVPVDMHVPGTELKQKFDDLFDRIEKASPRYCQLELANRQHTAIGGFAYLNSPTSALVQSEMQKDMRATVEAVGEPELAELYALWTDTNDRRELAMITGVEAFARHASFKKAVVLVGAAHRQPLFLKSRLTPSDGPSSVIWDFDWQLEEAALDGDAGLSGETTDRARWADYGLTLQPTGACGADLWPPMHRVSRWRESTTIVTSLAGDVAGLVAGPRAFRVISRKVRCRVKSFYADSSTLTSPRQPD